MLTAIQQDKAITYLRYALADLEGLLEDSNDYATCEAAKDTARVIQVFLNKLNPEAKPC